MSRRVTVMIPSYNYAEYLPEAVESAATQPEADVVVVDNGSTDASPEIGTRLADLYENVRFVRYDQNDGIIASFNRCRREIRADYAMLLCADDMLTPGSLGRSVAFLDEHSEVGLVYGEAIDFASSSDVDFDQLRREATASVVHDGDAWIDRLCRFGRNPIRTPEAVMRSAVAEAAGPYEPACRFTSDLNMWLRVAARSKVGYLRGPVQALFRQHGANEGAAYPHNSLAELEQRWTAFDRFFDSLDGDGRVARWEPLARRRVASEARYSASRAYLHPSSGEVEALLALADRIDPGGAGAVERLGWSLRRRLGPAATGLLPVFNLRPVAHRIRTVSAEQRRARVGIG